MYIRTYMQKKLRKDIFAGYFSCSKCGKISRFHLCRIKQRTSILFIPVCSVTTDRILLCDTCGTYKEIDRREYRSMKKEQEKAAKEGRFPESVIKTDYCPAEIKYGRKLAALILSFLFAFYMMIGTIGMLTDISIWDASVPIGGFIMIAIGVLPFSFALKSFMSAKWKRRLYESAMKPVMK